MICMVESSLNDSKAVIIRHQEYTYSRQTNLITIGEVIYVFSPVNKKNTQKKHESSIERISGGKFCHIQK